MRSLILGGTAWLGRELTRTALAAGHDVTCLARGTAVAPGATLVRADRDEPDAYDEVAATDWDLVIDLSREPFHASGAVAALGSRAAAYVFVSTASVYASQTVRDQDEDAAILPALPEAYMESPVQYGEAKVACEAAVLHGHPRPLIVRPGLIGGPGDPSGRTTYWPWRFRHPATPAGDVLTPDAPTQPSSVIDVRDLAGWIIAAADAGVTGIFNATGEVTPLGVHLATARQIADHEGDLISAEPDWLIAHGVGGWGGPRSLPIWLDDATMVGIHTHRSDRALAAGLVRRPLAETLRDGLATRETEAPLKPAGLTDEEERELLAAAAPH